MRLHTRAELDDGWLTDLAARVAAANADPTQHVGYLGTEAAGVATELRELAPGTLIAFSEDPWGVLAAEWDSDLGRTWLFGPYVGSLQWTDVADALYAAIRDRLPAGVGEHEVFFDARHDRLEAFAQRHGFGLQGEHAIYRLDRSALPPEPESTEPLPESHVDSFAALHASAFPRTHASARSILAGERHFLRPIAVLDGPELVGYVAVTVEPEQGAANLEYIAVAPVRQGLGVGTRLLAAAARAAFAHETVRELQLTVSTANVSAVRVYEKAGYRLERTMRAYRTRP